MKDGNLKVKEEESRELACINEELKDLPIVYFDITKGCICPISCSDRKRPVCDLDEVESLLYRIRAAGIKEMVIISDMERDDHVQIISRLFGIGLKFSFIIESHSFKVAKYQHGRAFIYDNIISPERSNVENKDGAPVKCTAGYGSCYVSPCGVVTPCEYVPLRCGDLRSENLSDIWRESFLMNLFRYSLENPPECERCDLYR